MFPMRLGRFHSLNALCVAACVVAGCLLKAPSTHADAPGALSNPTGRPLGGGEDYGNWVRRPPAEWVRTSGQLLNALRDAQPGDIIYVADNAAIDLTFLPEEHEAVEGGSILIKPYTTLASGRGRAGSRGGLLFSNLQAPRSLFKVTGTDVRITGLRIRGPDMGIEAPGCGGKDATGIEIISESGGYLDWSVEIDNNELWGWPDSAVKVIWLRGPRIHHNHIHHNRREMHKPECDRKLWYGRGYGIEASQGRTLIEANVFDHNRHDIASNGSPGAEYEARYNLILDGAIQHSFDVHDDPCPDSHLCPDDHDGYVAGTRFDIHHNTFLQNHKPAVHVRERPIIGAWIQHNEFLHGTQAGAVKQSNDSGNFFVSDNAYGVNRFPAWFVSFSGESTWTFRRFEHYGVDEVAFGDFNRDGRSDAFRVSNGRWQLSMAGKGDWREVQSSDVPFQELAFGDFDGDRHTDVFRRTPHDTWEVSFGRVIGATSGRMTRWLEVQSSDVPFRELAFGDFDGDGHTDVFRHTPHDTWEVSFGRAVGTASGRMSRWREVQSSDEPVRKLAFGDFDGDGHTDVFRHTPHDTWEVSFGRAVSAASGRMSRWREVQSSDVPFREFAFGDFDGDRHTDVFRHTPHDTWEVSFSRAVHADNGRMSEWQEINRSDFDLADLAFADVNGDGRTDVLAMRNP